MIGVLRTKQSRENSTLYYGTDDIRISDMNKAVESSVIDYLASRYGKEAPLTVNRGKNINILG